MNGIEIVEDFYGEPLNGDLVTSVANTPDDQLHELAERFRDIGGTLSTYPLPQPSIAARGAEGDIPPMAVDHLCLPSSIDRPLAQSSTLKRLALYVDSLVVADPVVLWALSLQQWDSPVLPALQPTNSNDIAPNQRLARILNGLLPLEALIRLGVIRLSNPPGLRWNEGVAVSDNLSVQYALAARVPDLIKGVLSISTDDRERVFLEELLATDIDTTDYVWGVSRLARWAVDDFYGEIDEAQVVWGAAEAVLRGAVNPSDYRQSILDAVAFDDFTFVHSVIPVATNVPNQRLLSFSPERRDMAGRPSSILERAGLPSVPVEWSELIALRRSEEVFSLFREAIAGALASLEDESSADPYDVAYRFAEAIDDQVGPVLKRLEVQFRRSTALQKVVPRIARFAFSMSARFVPNSFPGAAGAAGRLGERAGTAAIRGSAEKGNAATVARRVLVALRTGA